MKNRFPALCATVSIAAILVTSCATPPADSGSAKPPTTTTMAHRTSPAISPALEEAARRTRLPNPDAADDNARIYKGTGVVVKGQVPGGGLPGATPVPAGGGNVVLNFEGADLREVVKNILGDILNEAYTIDAAVGGVVTIRTSSGIPRDALPATLETLLRMNGATMVKEGGLYKILPSAVAVRGNVTPQLGNSQRSLPPGFSVQIVPLRYIGTREMIRVLEPLAKDATSIRPDDLRNLLILSGTERELRHLIETIELFDVDWIAGMSVGLFVLQYADVKAVGQELDKIVGDRNTGPLAGILRIIPIERMNALLVITPQPAYLDEAKKWIARLDQGGGGDGPRFYVYNLQNQRAEKLGPLLTQAFTGRAAPAGATPAPTVAPGTPAGTIVSPPTFQSQAAGGHAAGTGNPDPGRRGPGDCARRGGNRHRAQHPGRGRQGQQHAAHRRDRAGIHGDRSRAEEARRAVTAGCDRSHDRIGHAHGRARFRRGMAVPGRVAQRTRRGRPHHARRRRSIPSLPQVNRRRPVRGSGSRRASPTSSTTRPFPAAYRACCICSTRTATPKSSPIRTSRPSTTRRRRSRRATRFRSTRTAIVGSGVNTATNVVTTTSQYIDTGVLLQVTPHINAGGLVTLDVQAEVSDPGPVLNPGDAPPINTRSVQTIVNVQSGQTMVMGGLIGETSGNSSKGLPLLSRIPIIGGLFGDQQLTKNRTELVMFITPRVVENEIDLKATIEDLRRRMQQIDDTFDVFRRAKSPDPYGSAPKP